MKILLISNMYPSKIDPTYGTFVKVFKEELEKTDKSICIEKIVINRRTESNLFRLLLYIPYYFKIFFTLLVSNYDIVYMHQGTHSSPPMILARLFKKFRFVLNFHGSDVITIGTIDEVLFKLSKPLYKSCDLIVVPSLFFQGEVSKRLPDIDSEKFFISPSGGVNNDVFTSVNKTTDTGIGVCVSRIDKGKGWDTVLNAICILKRDLEAMCPCIKFIGYGTEVPALIKMIRDLEIEDVCEYVGPLPHERLCNAYHLADFSIFPTQLKESLGLVGLEALTCGCPVIGSNIGCLPEFIKHKINGFLIEPGNAVLLAETIKNFYTLDRREREDMQKNAIITSKEYHSKEVANKMADRLRKLCIKR